MKSTWPEADLNKVDKKAISDMQLIQGIVTAVRTVKSEMNVPPSKTVDVIINNVKSEETKKILEKYVSYLKSLARIENVQVGSAQPKPAQAAVAVVAEMELFIPLSGLIDFEKEKARLQKEILNAEGEIARCNKNLSNEKFVEKAPKAEVERIRGRLSEAEAKIVNLKKSLEALK
jgi:valyl-tRNA synthetase